MSAWATAQRRLTINELDRQIMLTSLVDMRNKCLEEGTPTDDVNEALLKVINAKTWRERRKAERER